MTRELSIDEVVSWDRSFGALAAAMWSVAALKLAPLVQASATVQITLCALALLGITVAWPTLHRRSYGRYRVPALALLRFFLYAQPFVFNREVLDSFAPELNPAHFGLVGVFQAIMATRVGQLWFSCLGLRVPFRVHMALQACTILLLAVFGGHVYCNSKLLSGPKMDAAVNSFHGWAALVASVAAPPIRVIVPGDINARRMAALLFSWTTLGWLLPTLLLLPKPAAAPRRARQQVTAQERGGGGLAGRAAGCVEACLRLLLCRQPHQQVRRCDRCSGGACALAWFIALVGTWGASCLVAPLLV